MSSRVSSGVHCSRTLAELFSSGSTLRKMRMARHSEQNGSTRNQPKLDIRIELMMTATEPSVSASTCRNTPKS